MTSALNNNYPLTPTTILESHGCTHWQVVVIRMADRTGLTIFCFTRQKETHRPGWYFFAV